LPELTNKETKEYPNETLSIQKSDLEIIIFISLIFKDIITIRRTDIIEINNKDFKKISKNILIGHSSLDILSFISFR
tara:strand:+ start:239 stop:469 length:231 start_codon:yes stop_codon:yes gene_type:complete